MPDPDFIDLDGDFRVNMYRQTTNDIRINRDAVQKPAQTTQMSTQTTQIPTQTTRLNPLSFTEEDKAILTLVYNQPELTQRELAMELGWTVDRVKYYLNKMKKQQIIRRKGSSHNGRWEFLLEENAWKR